MSDELTRRTLDLFRDLRVKAEELARRQLLPAGRAIIHGGDDKVALSADEKVAADAGRSALLRLADGTTIGALTPEERAGLHFVLRARGRWSLSASSPALGDGKEP